MLFFWGVISFLLLIGLMSDEVLITINIHATYFLISNTHALYFAGIFLSFIGLIYFTIHKLKIVLIKWITIVHTLFTIIGTIFFLHPISLIQTKQYQGFPDIPVNINTELVLALMLIVGIQVLLLINISLGLFRKKKSIQ
tara:strand:+ start:12748 stop:13167 length:420 start_codon:yes stop_codon:yes gene_type:complete